MCEVHRRSKNQYRTTRCEKVQQSIVLSFGGGRTHWRNRVYRLLPIIQTTRERQASNQLISQAMPICVYGRVWIENGAAFPVSDAILSLPGSGSEVCFGRIAFATFGWICPPPPPESAFAPLESVLMWQGNLGYAQLSACIFHDLVCQAWSYF
ncbi:hypothetical protein CDEST_08039 [Colletotrichum destructivum]|uniref:Uncharacterized protein n=1 Tax=Colletotrichum destructivum TaxID=34406 RepID=A0AAX4IJ00_9PEZI|nr:hypothetical protein CDEST_08039 [Colletotrichum destructivum]